MKKILVFCFTLVLFSHHSALSQEKNPLLDLLTKKIEERLIPKKKEQKKTTTKKKENSVLSKPSKNSIENYPLIEIPVVFHVINSCESDKSAYRKRIKNLLTLVNSGMNSPDKSKILRPYKTKISSPNIKLMLAGDILGCLKNKDISYHTSQYSPFLTQNADLKFQLRYDQKLKKHGYVNSKRVLNIWICDLEGNDGYSSFPQEGNPLNEGIVLNKKRFDDGTSMNLLRFLLTHELGHYFGLQHLWGLDVWANGCLIRNDDGINDTPRQKGKNQNNHMGNKNGLMHKVCGNKSQLSNFQNFMDYANYIGMFTEDQVTLMRNQIEIYRRRLSNGINCNLIPKDLGNCTSSGANTQSNSGPVADVCMSNYISYQRRVVLTHRTSGLKKTVLIAQGHHRNPKVSCLYEIPSGVYNCKVYTTFSNALIEDFEVKLGSNQSNQIKLTQHGN